MSMASIESLLNPQPSSSEERVLREHGEPQVSFTLARTPGPGRPRGVFAPHLKKARVPKDAPIFVAGETRGKVRYPPCEKRDDMLKEEHKRFCIYPTENISGYPRHIPYSSEKKSLMEKTGRESFEVFQYTFKTPGKDKEWIVMWDYNIGLVRTTHLFKCNDYPKTTPAKMLNSNTGLRDICHSITGGALAAQGYWMPFEAARAVAATFCWNIRYALTPIFGTDFPSQCIPPQSRQFGKMTIDPSIIRHAAELSNKYRQLELGAKTHTNSQHRLLSPNDASGATSYTQPWSASEGYSGQGIAHSNTYPESGGVSVQEKRSEIQSPTDSVRDNNNNTFTPINTSEGVTTQEQRETTRRHLSQSKTSTSQSLPSMKEVMDCGNFEYLCANPLKRRLSNDRQGEQNIKPISPRDQHSMMNSPEPSLPLRHGKERMQKRVVNDEDDDEDIDDDNYSDAMSMDDGTSSSSFYEPSSDSDSDSGTSSESESTDASDDDARRKSQSRRKSFCRTKRTRQLRTRKVEKRKNRHTTTKKAKKVNVPWRLSTEHRRSRCNTLRRNERKMSSIYPSPASTKSPSLLRQNPTNHRDRDLKAAETLLALKSGSSTVSEGDNESSDHRDTSSSVDENGNVSVGDKGAEKRGEPSTQKGEMEKKPGKSGLLAGAPSELCERTVKRARRASF